MGRTPHNELLEYYLYINYITQNRLDEVKKYIDEPTNWKIAQNVYNIIQNILYNSSEKKIYSNILNRYIPDIPFEKFIDIFGTPKIISTGTSGITFKASLNISGKSISDALVIKFLIKQTTVSNKDGIEEMERELKITYHLNELRKETRGFMYGFGGFYCGIENKQQQICKTNDKSFVNIYEYINGSTFFDMVGNGMTEYNAIEILLQLMKNLVIAQTKFKFMHYALHTKNILIITHNSPINISIGNFNFTTIYEPVMVDFGHSQIHDEDFYETFDIEYLLYTLYGYEYLEEILYNEDNNVFYNIMQYIDFFIHRIKVLYGKFAPYAK